MTLARIGATPKGGVCRLAPTDLDRQAREQVIAWAREAGMTITIDRIGNCFMRRPGRNHLLPPVMTGSHIDTQPTGGKFDSNYGVLAGLEVVRTLKDHGIQTEAPIEVAFWTNEEGSRFVPVMMGSGVFAKAFTLEHAYAAKDADGKTVRDELERIGFVGTEEPGDHPIGAYFEAHIEQGPVLEDARVTCINYHSPGIDSDERSYARLAAARAQRELIERERIAGFRLESILHAAPTPTPGNHVGRMGSAQMDAEVAAAHGASALFTGGGGDQLFFEFRQCWPAADYLCLRGLDRGFTAAV
ncbi:MAG: M20/M25/M40 family metallo-hydrolase [Rubrivivax sp.]|nr:M20/M25/M40 family metallo-hydrolase [Rubrivivax sp.]